MAAPERKKKMLDTQAQKSRLLQGQGVPDGVLVEQARAGDQRAFECLVNRYHRSLASYLIRSVKLPVFHAPANAFFHCARVSYGQRVRSLPGLKRERSLQAFDSRRFLLASLQVRG